MHLDPGVGPAEIGAAIAAAIYGGVRVFARLRNGKTPTSAEGLAAVVERLTVLETKVDLILDSMRLHLRE